MIFDTHCHFNHEDLYKDVDTYLKRALEAGVKKFLVVGYDKDSSLRAVELAHKYECMYAAIGYHPTEIHNLSEEDFVIVMNLLDDEKVVALGEIGLDYHWEKEDHLKNEQKAYFIRQIEEANKHNLPISIHCRDATQDTLDILKEHRVNKGGVMHCYAGSVELLKDFYKLGFYISLGGPVTFKNSKTPKEVAANVDLDRLLVETDSPYLAPHPFRGQQNEPSYITLVVDEIARLNNVDKSIIEDRTYQNALRLFGIDENKD